MKKFAKLPLILALAYFIISIPLSNDTVYADEPLHENNTTTLVATTDSQEELIGTDFITITPSPFRSHKTIPTHKFYLKMPLDKFE